MGNILKLVSDAIVKAIPGENYRTRFIALAQLVYALFGVISGQMSPDQAGLIAATAIGLLTARAGKTGT